MPQHQRSRRLAIAVACATAVTGACTPAPSNTAPAAGAASTGAASSSSLAGKALTIDIMIANGQVTPNGQKINVTRGQTVVLRVTSDVEDEVHAHTAGDGYELEVHPGEPTRGQFVAADTGTFEVELHHLDKIVAIRSSAERPAAQLRR